MFKYLSDDYAYLRTHREIWQQKPILRRVYEEQFYKPLLETQASGNTTIEIGSGPGFVKDFDPAIWCTDILPSPWIHCAADAHQMPFGDGTIDNIIGLDVLHHFDQPLNMLREAKRLLRPGGRLLLVEPWITLFSRFVYTYLHQEACDLRAQPWLDNVSHFENDKNAFDGNAAIPYLLLTKSNGAIEDQIPELRLIQLQMFSSLTYLLSGGFKRFNLLPQALYTPLYMLERAIHRILGRLIALRAFIVWEKV